MTDLYIGRRKTGVSIEQDETYPSMWRVRQGDELSDMVNLTRAKDASISWAQRAGFVVNNAHQPSWKAAHKATA